MPSQWTNRLAIAVTRGTQHPIPQTRVRLRIRANPLRSGVQSLQESNQRRYEKRVHLEPIVPRYSRLMLTRRSAVLAPLAAAAIPQVSLAANTKMGLSIHMTTTQNAGYKGSLEGWAKAGIKYVEVTDRALDDFLKTESIATAKRMVGDLGLTIVSCASVLQDFWNKNPGYAAQLETWKKRCEQYASLGSPRIYCPSTTSRKVTADDYKTCPEAIREAGDIAKQHNLVAMIEFTRASTLLSTLTTALKVIREANHPNVKPMLDC